MVFLLFSAAALFVSGIVAVMFYRKPAGAVKIGLTGAVIGSITGLIPCIQILFGRQEQIQVLQWGCFSFCLERFPAIFLLPLLILIPLCAFHAVNYIKERASCFWFFFNLLCTAILLIPLIDFRNSVAFLFCWELMGMSSFALVLFEYSNHETRRASWVYLLSAHAGAMFLIPMFLLLGRGGTDSPGTAMVIFILAVIGFGLKAGLALLHFWLPPAHAAAPAPVSALMSAAMNNMGIYGILKVAMLTGLSLYSGWILLCIGLAGCLGAIIFALAQEHIKRLIAYSSVENFGIMTLAFGLGIIGLNSSLPEMAVLGFCGGFLHLYNHSVLKALLFLGAGSIHLGTGTYKMEKMGGLLKKMPVTGGTFLLGSIGISGIPPFNAFLSEFLIYAAALYGVMDFGNLPVFSISLVTVIVLALTGGTATAAFAKLAGIVFLGEPRSELAGHAKESPWQTTGPLLILGFLALTIAVWAPLLVSVFLPVAGQAALLVAEADAGEILRAAGGVSSMLMHVCIICGLLLSVFAVLLLLRHSVACRREEESGLTWDCGYAEPTSRMQYTGASFSAPLENFFHEILKKKIHLYKPSGIFPDKSV